MTRVRQARPDHPGTIEPTTRATGLSLAVIVLGLVAVVAVTVLHVARGDVDPLRQMMSEYANGRLGLVMTVVFHATGLAAIALGVRTGRALRPGPLVASVRWGLGLGGLGLVVAGIYEVGRPLDPETLEESIHSIASIMAFSLLVAAMGGFAVACRSDPRWRTYRPVATGLAVAAGVLALLSPLATNAPWGGVVQRLLGLVVIAWLMLTAVRIRTNAFASAAPGTPSG